MPQYRDKYLASHGFEVANVVGCALDRLHMDGEVNHDDENMALSFFEDYGKYLSAPVPIGTRREIVYKFVKCGGRLPRDLYNVIMEKLCDEHEGDISLADKAQKLGLKILSKE